MRNYDGSGWLGAADPQRAAAFQRALTVSGAGTVLLDTSINKVVQQLVLREFGGWGALPHKPGSGDAAYINRRTAGTTGGAWVADTTTSTEETGSVAQVSFTYRTALTKGQVTRKLMATGRSYGDVLAQELAGKTNDFYNLLEDGVFNGDNAANSNQINGLLTLINAQTAQVVAQTTATAGDSVTLAKLDQAIDTVRGAGNRSDLVIFGSFLGLRKLNAALQGSQRFVESGEISAGFRVRMYDGIPMVVSTAIGNAMTWSGSVISAFTGGSTTALVVVNKALNWIEELTPVTVMPLARTTSQNDNFEMFSDLAVVFSNTKGGAILGGIAGS